MSICSGHSRCAMRSWGVWQDNASGFVLACALVLVGSGKRRKW